MLHPLCVCDSCVVMVAHRKLVFLFLNHTSVASVFISALPMGQFPPISSTPTLSMNWNYFEKCMFRWASEKYTIIIEEIPAASFDIWFCHKTENNDNHKKANVIDDEKTKCYVGKLGSVRFLNSSICIRRQTAPIRLQKTPLYLCLLLFQQVGNLLISATEAPLTKHPPEICREAMDAHQDESTFFERYREGAWKTAQCERESDG